MLGVRYMARTGYSADAMTSFFEKMSAHADLERALAGKENEAVPHNIMATHPRTAQRISQAIRLAKGITVADPVVGRGEYLAEIDGMTFGDDPEQGIRRGRTFIHPGLRIRFRVPPGFVLFNSPRQVTARGPRQSMVIFDMAPDNTARQVRSLTAYLTRAWGSKLTLKDVEKINVNGLDAATAEARMSSRAGAQDIRLLVIRGGAGKIFRFAFISHPDMTAGLWVEFQRTTFSFRHISEEEVALIKPLKIKVASVRAGDTAESLAAGMPFEKFRLRWFEVINRLRLEAGLTPGTAVKTVQ